MLIFFFPPKLFPSLVVIIMMEIIILYKSISSRLQSCASITTHTASKRFIYELSFDATNPLMFEIYGFDAAAKLTLSSSATRFE